MKTIGKHNTPKAGEFEIAYDETPNLSDSDYITLIYHITDSEGLTFQNALIALRAFIPTPADALALMETKGLKRLKARLDSMDAAGFVTLSPPSFEDGFEIQPVTSASAN